MNDEVEVSEVEQEVVKLDSPEELAANEQGFEILNEELKDELSNNKGDEQ